MPANETNPALGVPDPEQNNNEREKNRAQAASSAPMPLQQPATPAPKKPEITKEAEITKDDVLTKVAKSVSGKLREAGTNGKLDYAFLLDLSAKMVDILFLAQKAEKTPSSYESVGQPKAQSQTSMPLTPPADTPKSPQTDMANAAPGGDQSGKVAAVPETPENNSIVPPPL